jgi:hypothetical protein
VSTTQLKRPVGYVVDAPAATSDNGGSGALITVGMSELRVAGYAGVGTSVLWPGLVQKTMVMIAVAHDLACQDQRLARAARRRPTSTGALAAVYVR